MQGLVPHAAKAIKGPIFSGETLKVILKLSL